MDPFYPPGAAPDGEPTPVSAAIATGATPHDDVPFYPEFLKRSLLCPSPDLLRHCKGHCRTCEQAKRE
jgi:hypothetical protein